MKYEASASRQEICNAIAAGDPLRGQMESQILDTAQSWEHALPFHRDGAELARRLKADLESNGFDSWLDTSDIAGNAVWSLEIERELDHRQVTIALLSPGSYASEICRAEQLRALDKGNRVLPVLAVQGADRPIYLYIRQYLDFTSEEQYAARFQELLKCIQSGETATLPDRYRSTPVKFITAPARVANLVDRPEAVAALRDALFAEDHRMGAVHHAVKSVQSAR